MEARIEWIDDVPQTLGALTAQEAEIVAVEAAEHEEKKFSTEEKLLIASLLMSIVSISWQVFQWRKENKK